MDIFYKQSEDSSTFEKAGIKNCRFKHHLRKSDTINITPKKHHHTEFEIHIIINGFQVYRTESKQYRVNAGEMIIIPPEIKHCCTKSSGGLLKYVITFKTVKSFNLNNLQHCLVLKAEKHIYDNIEFVLKESKLKLFFSPFLSENRAFETVIGILRMCNFAETRINETKESDDVRLLAAKQYIKDNIELNLKVSDVARYCYISSRQLNRLFAKSDSITPSDFITKQKVEKIEKLLSESSASLKEISEIMNFSSEYHFNLFFKKYSGMPPGEFRKMIK